MDFVDFARFWRAHIVKRLSLVHLENFVDFEYFWDFGSPHRKTFKFCAGSQGPRTPPPGLRTSILADFSLFYSDFGDFRDPGTQKPGFPKTPGPFTQRYDTRNPGLRIPGAQDSAPRPYF